MRAIVIREHGGVERLVLTPVPDPLPAQGQALVRVRAVALNHLDLWVRRGVPGSVLRRSRSRAFGEPEWWPRPAGPPRRRERGSLEPKNPSSTVSAIFSPRYGESPKRGVDVVVEHVGADTFERSLRCLARGGRLVTCGATSGAEVTVNLRLVFFKLLSILGSTLGSLAELHAIMGHVERGELHPVVDRILPFEAVAEAHRVLEEREAFGKVVLEM